MNKTTNGKVFKCANCDKIHLEYKNLSFSFTNNEFEFFKNYIISIDGDKWESRNSNSFFDRKIHISIKHESFNIILHNYELEELRCLLDIKKEIKSNFKYLNLQDIFDNTCLN